MRKLVLFMHSSLDGFVAGPNGEMDWIKADEELFDYIHHKIEATDTALYGRVTYDMMEGYWPTAADQPNASKHDREHAAWYKKAKKVVISKSMAGQQKDNTIIISDNLAGQVNAIKNQPGKEIIIFGSPSASHALMRHNLIDEFWLFVNPMVIGEGIPVFKDVQQRISLELKDHMVFSSGVVCLHHVKKGQ